MDVKQILSKWLTENGFQGLYNADVRCGCDVDDLNPCGDCAMECKPAYKTKCNPNCESKCDAFDEKATCYTTVKPVT